MLYVMRKDGSHFACLGHCVLPTLQEAKDAGLNTGFSILVYSSKCKLFSCISKLLPTYFLTS